MDSVLLLTPRNLEKETSERVNSRSAARLMVSCTAVINTYS